MIEVSVLDYLNSNLTERVYTEIPKTMPEKFYVLEKTGGGLSNHISKSSFALQAYGKSMYEAASMIYTAKDNLLADTFLELSEICSIQWDGEYNFTSETQKKYRYQAVFSVTHY